MRGINEQRLQSAAAIIPNSEARAIPVSNGSVEDSGEGTGAKLGGVGGSGEGWGSN